MRPAGPDWFDRHASELAVRGMEAFRTERRHRLGDRPAGLAPQSRVPADARHTFASRARNGPDRGSGRSVSVRCWRARPNACVKARKFGTPRPNRRLSSRRVSGRRRCRAPGHRVRRLPGPDRSAAVQDGEQRVQRDGAVDAGEESDVRLAIGRPRPTSGARTPPSSRSEARRRFSSRVRCGPVEPPSGQGLMTAESTIPSAALRSAADVP